MPDLYIGLISGTSIDGVDAVIAEFDDRACRILGTHRLEYSPALAADLRQAIAVPGECDVDTVGSLDARVGAEFANAALEVLGQSDIRAADIRAVGSHGQTLRHRPDAAHRFTLQLGDPNRIAARTGIDTVADFRRADMALGGEGAPLVPPFHDWLLRKHGTDRIVLNLGGIANVTVLPGDDADVAGFDTGPANALLDAWIRSRRGLEFDDGGRWAASGSTDATLLAALLDDAYFRRPPPKSTGTEYFNLDWLERRAPEGLADEDVQATLLTLSARTIGDAIRSSAPATQELFVCGGGARNTALLDALHRELDGIEIRSTAVAGVDPDWVEACAFAWLADRYLKQQPGNLPAVTGARRETVLGALYRAPTDT